MRQSHFFAKTQKEFPKDERAANAQFLIRGGYIDKLMAGVYTLLPLGLRVVRNIERIVRQEMNAGGGQELFMPALQPKELWEETGRWEKLKGHMYQFQDSSGKDMGLGFTHEEVILGVARQRIFSYKDLPLCLYQIQSKFRDEPRPRSGLIRGREFIMKDAYSFHADRKDLDIFYQQMRTVYEKIFRRLCLDAIYTEAGGGVFTEENTHEFQVLAENGEDTIFYCRNKDFSHNKEVAKVKEGDACPVDGGIIQKGNAIEIGNIFRFDDVFSKQMNFSYRAQDGERKRIYFGSYGLGITRAMAAVVEVRSSKTKIIWPKEIAPFSVHVVAIFSQKPDKVQKEAESLYEALRKKGIDVLYDDRKERTGGEKFADADLLGIPLRIIVSERSVGQGGVEFHEPGRQGKIVTTEEAVRRLVEEHT